jgi:DNA-directed RNA polymerase subunit K/omega
MEQTHREAEQTLPRRGFEFQVTWPGIVSRFQLVILAGRRSKQLYALEELRRGRITIIDENGIPPQTVLVSNDTTVNTTIVKPRPHFDLPKAEYVNERP